jgi:acetyl-CoA carboxylase biotin carboxyl carrier protein
MAQVAANMAGTVFKVLVQPGESVTAGQDLIVLESMKMEIPIAAEAGGTVVEIKVNVGDFVNDGDIVVVLGD